MNARFALLSGIVALAAFPVSAEVYRQVDAQGNVTYTDEPSEGTPAEEIKVKPVTTVTLPKLEAVAGKSATGRLRLRQRPFPRAGR